MGSYTGGSGNPENLGFGFYVEDQATHTLSKVEKSYHHTLKSMDVATRGITDNLQAYSERYQEVIDETEEHIETQKKSSSKFDEAKDAIKENWLGLDKLGLSWKSFLSFLAAASVGAAIVGVISFLTSAAKKAAEFGKELAKLNEAYSMSAKDAAVVGSALFGLEKRAGRTREEVAGMLRTMLDLGLTPKFAKQSGLAFKDLARDVLDFSSATGMSAESSATFFDQLIRINRVPATSVRGIGNAIKAIADNTRISTDELVSFNKNLEPLFGYIGGRSAKARKEFTLSMAALAGELSNLGIDAGRATQDFESMLNVMDAEGQHKLGLLANTMGESSTAIRDLLKNDPAKFFDKFSQSLAGKTNQELQFLATHIKPLGLNFAELSNLAERGADTLAGRADSFVDAAQKAMEAAQREEELAKKAAKRQEALEALGNRLSKMWEKINLRIGGALLKHLIPVLEKHLVPLLDYIANWIATVDWDKVFGSIIKGFKDIYDWTAKNKAFIQEYWDLFTFLGKGALKILGFMFPGLTAAAATAFTLMTTDSSKFKDEVRTHWNSIKDKSAEVWGVVKVEGAKALTHIEGFMIKVFGEERVNKWKETALGALTSWWDWIKDKLSVLKNIIQNIASGKLGAIVAGVLDDSGGESFFDRLSKAGSDLIAPEKITTTPKGKKGTTVEALAKKGETSAGFTDLGSPTDKFPAQMITSSPSQERLLGKMVMLQQEMVSELRKTRGPSNSASSQRHARLAEISGS